MARQTQEGRRFREELLDELMAGADPAEVFRDGGQIEDSKKAAAERALDAEMDAHLDREPERSPGKRALYREVRRILKSGGWLVLSEVVQGTDGTRLQPVFVGDVAEACARVLADPDTQGRVYELGGPRVYVYRDLVQLVLDRTGARTALVPVPFLVWDVLACGLALLPHLPLTHDQMKRMKRDYVVGREARELGELGIRPIVLEEALPDWTPNW